MSKEDDDKEKSSSLKIRRLINSRDKGSGQTSNVIAKLFRVMLIELDITLDKFTILKSKWLNDPNNHIRNTRTAKSTASSNLVKDIIKDTMTVDVFLKMMSLLKVESISFSVSIKRKGHLRPTEHTVMIDDLPGYISTRKTSRHTAEKKDPKEETEATEESKQPKNPNTTLDEKTAEFDRKVREIIDSLNTKRK